MFVCIMHDQWSVVPERWDKKFSQSRVRALIGSLIALRQTYFCDPWQYLPISIARRLVPCVRSKKRPRKVDDVVRCNWRTLVVSLTEAMVGVQKGARQAFFEVSEISSYPTREDADWTSATIHHFPSP